MFDPHSVDYNRRWAAWRRRVDLDEYEARFEPGDATAWSAHGEADAVSRLLPDGGSVLDAGCGTGRIAIELDRRGYDVVGIDADPDMLARARHKRPDMRWDLGDISRLDLPASFDLVLAAGNVMIFLADGTEARAVAAMARRLRVGGLLVAGFSVGGSAADGISLADYDTFCEVAGLTPSHRWSTWQGAPYRPRDACDGADGYAVSIHRLEAGRLRPS